MSDMHTQPYDDVKKPKDIGTEIKQELEAWNARKEKASAYPRREKKLSALSIKKSHRWHDIDYGNRI